MKTKTQTINEQLEESANKGIRNRITEKMTEMSCYAAVEGEEEMERKFFARRTLIGFTTRII